MQWKDPAALDYCMSCSQPVISAAKFELTPGASLGGGFHLWSAPPRTADALHDAVTAKIDLGVGEAGGPAPMVQGSDGKSYYASDDDGAGAAGEGVRSQTA